MFLQFVRNAGNKAFVRKIAHASFAAAFMFSREENDTKNSSVNYTESPLPPLPVNSINIPSPDLTHAFLIKQATLLSLETSTITLNRTLSALLDLSHSYTKSLSELTSIYQTNTENLPIIFTSQELYDEMVRLKIKVKSEKHQLLELKMLFDYAKKLMESSIEASFLGAESASVQASENLAKSQLAVDRELRRWSELELDLRIAEKEHVEFTSSKQIQLDKSSDKFLPDKESMVKSTKDLIPVKKDSEVPASDIKVSSYEDEVEEKEENRFTFEHYSDEDVKISVKVEEDKDDILITEKEDEEEAHKDDNPDDGGQEDGCQDDVRQGEAAKEQYKMPTF